jgi:hypothetical protein
MKTSSLLALLLSFTWAFEASAIGWECNNEWGGHYRFTVTGGNVGVAEYDGPIDLGDILTHTSRHLDGSFSNLAPYQSFDFQFPGFAYSCSVRAEGAPGSTYDCMSLVGNAPIKLNNCHGFLL